MLCSVWINRQGRLTNPTHVTPPHHGRLLSRLQVFAGDQFAIDQARQQLRVEFARHKDVRDPHEIRA